MEELNGQIPLVVGVTGHRDLRPQDVPLLEREFEQIIARLRRDYAGGEEAVPIVLLSALAEGADTVAARTALKLGLKLVAPLPLQPQEYRRDFEQGIAADAASAFDSLLSQAVVTRVMDFVQDNTPENVRSDPDRRALQYREVGLFIAQHCDLLVAFWDGNQSDRAVGGTAEVVAFKREGIPLAIARPAALSLEGSEIGPVIHVVTPRARPGSAATAVDVRPWGKDIISRYRGSARHELGRRFKQFAFQLIGRDSEPDLAALPPEQQRDLKAWETFDALNALRREFNADSRSLQARTAREPTATGIDNLFRDVNFKAADAATKQRAIDVAPHWSHLFAIADALAQKRQAQFMRDWSALYCLSFVGFFLFVLSGYLEGNRDHVDLYQSLLGGYTFVVVVVFVLFVRARIMRDQERFLDYRAFAEALRVAVYWKLLGIMSEKPADDGARPAGTISAVADNYPIKQPSELAWVKTCLRTLDLYQPQAPTQSRGMTAEAHAIARQFWVGGQLAYFERQSASHNGHAELLESWSFIAVIITPVFLVLLLLSVAGEHHLLGFNTHNIFLVPSGILPGLAAALAGYSDRLAMAAQARQYERMRELFGRAYDLLPERLDETMAQPILQLYRQLGIEAMKESADWVAIYRQRPIKPIQ